MKTWTVAAGAALIGVFALAGCRYVDAGCGGMRAAVVKLPAGLEHWESRLAWEWSGSAGAVSQRTAVGVGTAVCLPEQWDPSGSWVLAQAMLPDGTVVPPDCGLPVLGWTSGLGAPAAGGVVADAPGGLCAWVMGRVAAAGARWEGFNLGRLEAEVRTRGIDSASADIERLAGAIAERDIAVWDLARRPTYRVAAELPEGRWWHAGTWYPGGAMAELNLPAGTALLLREDGAAWIWARAWRDGGGTWRLSWSLHGD